MASVLRRLAGQPGHDRARRESGQRAEHTDEGDRKKRVDGGQGEQRPARERADDLDPGLHGLEDGLGARVLTRLGVAADLGHRARHARDREDAFDQAQPDQPRDRSDERVERSEESRAEQRDDGEAAGAKTNPERSGVTAEESGLYGMSNPLKAD